jgi:crotonobetainyl-CoA:carnitine CoA-transferase CaiB-like acyl-CoA transferase
VNDPDVGPIPLPAPVPRLTGTPGAIRWTGPKLGAHNREVYCGELGLTEADLEALRRDKVI